MVLLLAIKAYDTKLDTKFAEAMKESDSLIETVSYLLVTVSSLTKDVAFLTYIREVLLWLTCCHLSGEAVLVKL